MTRQPSFAPSFASGESRESPGFDERRARYVFLSDLIEGAQVVEFLPPESAREPAARFLESLGAASAVSVCCTVSSPPTSDVLDGIAARSGGEPSIFVVDDGLSWIGAGEALEALISGVQSRLAFAHFLFVFRSASGLSLASFGSRSSVSDAGRFNFAAADRLLRQRFSSVRFATQCACWGSQLAPLDGSGEDCALDGRLADDGGRAAFFLALCSPERTNFPSELTVVPIPLQSLARSAARFDRLAEELHRSEAARTHLEETVRQRGAEADRAEKLASQAQAADKERSLADESRRLAEEKLKRAESLLDELASERALLVERAEKAEAELRGAVEARDAALEKCASAEASCKQASRERETHLALSREALARLQEKFDAARAENERLKAAQTEDGEAGRRQKPQRGAGKNRIAELEQALAEKARQAARLEALVQKQDQEIERLEAAGRGRASLEAGRSQAEAAISTLEARLTERELALDSLTQNLRELGRAVGVLERRRSGESIEALLDLYASIRGEIPAADDSVPDAPNSDDEADESEDNEDGF